MELILDASSRASQVGLSAGGSLQWSSQTLGPQEHSREFMPAVLQGMKTTAISFGDIEVITVALGPGPFNGLRVAVSTAKGLAVSLGVPIAGVSTLDAEVMRCRSGPRPVRPVLAAGRSGFTTALFVSDEHGWSCVEDARHASAPELAQGMSDRILLCGEVQALRETLESAGITLTASTAIEMCSRIEVLAQLGWRSFRRGDTVAAASLQPLYVNPPNITTPRDRRL